MILTPKELAELTGKRRSDAQRRALDHMRIPYRVRPDGSPVVMWAALEASRVVRREPVLQD